MITTETNYNEIQSLKRQVDKLTSVLKRIANETNSVYLALDKDPESISPMQAMQALSRINQGMLTIFSH